MEQHGIIGDAAYGIDLPTTEIDQVELATEKNMAKFSRTKEFKALKEHLETKIRFYQTFLPDGRVVGVGEIPTGEQWVIANTVIAEFTALIETYETANKTVQEANSAARSENS